MTIIITAALLASAVFAGALLARGQRRLDTILAERAVLTEALAGDAGTAEQLRMWSEVEQRIEPAIAALPGLVERAAHSGRAEDLEAVRARAADALGEMQATVRTLGSTEPLEPLPPEETTLRRLLEVLEEHGPVHARGGSPVAAADRAPSSRPPAPPTIPRLRLLAGRVRVLGGQLHVRRRRGATVVRVAFDSPERRRLRTISPLWLACALLFAGAVAEQVVLDPPGPVGARPAAAPAARAARADRGRLTLAAAALRPRPPTCSPPVCTRSRPTSSPRSRCS